jgi:hypothetical protein
MFRLMEVLLHASTRVLGWRTAEIIKQFSPALLSRQTSIHLPNSAKTCAK